MRDKTYHQSGSCTPCVCKPGYTSFGKESSQKNQSTKGAKLNKAFDEISEAKSLCKILIL